MSIYGEKADSAQPLRGVESAFFTLEIGKRCRKERSGEIYRPDFEIIDQISEL